ncbi:MAG: UDP-N-acetylglucosamine 2-epimerase (non-hydrolyzing) [Bacteroidetes bacterium CG12_big_fil_rev_8_21_14_0_65_60_17]|nr:MAG: UDP-N-acetylglucosamine 2-epimerase (non-hydrolyzing) [Bacteroidetes bacterium CG12_big_fil_rev_8_21_14_0_65_60_17]
MTICSVVGARPQFVKAAVVSHALRSRGVREYLLHTGQHYDDDMSAVFFDELGIPAPERNLGIGSGSHADQTARMMMALEIAFLDLRPERVLVYGDTNSTLAAALVAAKMHIPVDHVEAGLRSFNRRMPEEVNRIVTDRLSEFCFCPTQTAVEHLASEGRTEGVHLTGDVMLDATRVFAERAALRRPLISLTRHEAGSFALATVHRAENTDHPGRLSAIFDAFGSLDMPVLLPLHPRTRTRLADVDIPDNVEVMAPVSYLAMLTLTAGAACVLTDSGGLQKEALWLGTRCITLRDETEWTETTQGGWNQVVGADRKAIAAAVERVPAGLVPVFGAGSTDETPSEHISRLVAGSD